MQQMKTNLQKESSNKGFTLVEFIIVIAIIAILTGVSFVTLSMISSGRAKEAATSFESELTDMVTKSKNQVVVDNSGVQQPNFRQYLEVYKSSTGNYHLRRGYYDPDTSTYTAYVDSNGNTLRDVNLTSRVTVVYRTVDGTAVDIGEDSPVYIVYDNSGYCVEGNGTYEFYKNNDSLVAEVSVRKNGSHQYK